MAITFFTNNFLCEKQGIPLPELNAKIWTLNVWAPHGSAPKDAHRRRGAVVINSCWWLSGQRDPEWSAGLPAGWMHRNGSDVRQPNRGPADGQPAPDIAQHLQRFSRHRQV